MSFGVSILLSHQLARGAAKVAKVVTSTRAHARAARETQRLQRAYASACAGQRRAEAITVRFHYRQIVWLRHRPAWTTIEAL